MSGYRSAIATSLLRRAGFKVRDIFGGFAAISWTAPSHTTSGSVSNYSIAVSQYAMNYVCVCVCVYTVKLFWPGIDLQLSALLSGMSSDESNY